MTARPTAQLRIDRDHPDRESVARAATVLQQGGLVAFPTETVYGLGANALDAHAVRRIFEAKGRPSTDPVIVHLADAQQLDLVAREVPSAARALAAEFWPGPLTLIVPKAATVPDVVTAGLDSVAVRVPAHPVARALLVAAGVPIAAPSANRFSRPSPTLATHVLADLDGRIDLVLDAGATDIGVESTIVDCRASPPVVLRAGGVTLEALVRVVPDIGVRDVSGDAAQAQPAPGQLLRHYAPTATLTLYDGPRDAVVTTIVSDVRALVAQGTRVGLLAPDEHLTGLSPHLAPQMTAGRVTAASLGSIADPAQAARAMFVALRTLDAVPVDVILAVGPDRRELGLAVWDRLRRAAEGRVRRV